MKPLLLALLLSSCAFAADARANLDKARQEATQMHQQATALEFAAAVAWMKTLDLSRLHEPRSSSDERPSEARARGVAMKRNKIRALYAEILRMAEGAKDHGMRDNVVARVKMAQDEEGELLRFIIKWGVKDPPTTAAQAGQ